MLLLLDEGPGINQLTPQPYWAYCEILGDMEVRTRTEDGASLECCVPAVAFRGVTGSIFVNVINNKTCTMICHFYLFIYGK